MTDIRTAPEPLKVKAPDAYKFWSEYAPVLVDNGLMTDQDALAFEELAMCYQIMVMARNEVLENGVTDIDRVHGGMKKKNVALQVWRDSLSSFMRLSARFGILPADRKVLGVGATVAAFSLDDLLR